ncbi:MAG: ABC transporter ATP-binding protein/permease [Amoebophilaceae bacterium]|jgi:ATP-binding cassette subfamily B protein|nr:ABC transporter ATP-binding protein/permease [Amoebophilaceae bacterium]
MVGALHHLNKYLGRYRYLLVLGTVATLLSSALSIIPARLIKHAFELVQTSVVAYQVSVEAHLRRATYEKLAEGLFAYGVLMLLAAILRGLFLFLARRIIMVVGKRVEYALKNEIYAHYQTLPLSFYTRHSVGDMMARISEDVHQVGMYLGPAIAYGLNTVVVFLMLIPYMLVINTRLTLYAVLPIVLSTTGACYISSFMQERAATVQDKLSRLTTFVQESFSGIVVLQAFSRETGFIKVFSEACNTYKTQSLRLSVINALFFAVVKSIIGLGAVLVVFLGGQEVIKGRCKPGDIAEFVMYFNLLGWPTFAISWINVLVQKATASQKRINALLQEKNPIFSKEMLQNPIKGSIAFNNVSFTYPNSDVKALQSVHFEVAAGKMVAIIGTTGAGKSTIAHLICRLYDATAGSITIDGVPIQDYSIPYLRQQLGYVPQDVLLFSDTIRNNIAWGKPEATNLQIAQAAQLAAIYGEIQQLSKQMETMLGERGATLSGGQKQRIATARAFVRTPKILVLDDCLSAVDTKTAGDILHNIAKAMQGSAVLLITHSVFSAQFADHILVLEAGKLVEQGTHESLLAQKSLYNTLYKQQQYAK